MNFSGTCIGGPMDGQDFTCSSSRFAVEEYPPMHRVSAQFLSEDISKPVETRQIVYDFHELPVIAPPHIHSGLWIPSELTLNWALTRVLNDYREAQNVSK